MPFCQNAYAMPSSTGFTLSLRRLLILLSAFGLLPLALLGL